MIALLLARKRFAKPVDPPRTRRRIVNEETKLLTEPEACARLEALPPRRSPAAFPGEVIGSRTQGQAPTTRHVVRRSGRSWKASATGENISHNTPH